MNSSTTLKDFQGSISRSQAKTLSKRLPRQSVRRVYTGTTYAEFEAKKEDQGQFGGPKTIMKNEAVRVFFAVIALILVAMLTSPTGIDSPLNHPVQRRIAALESEAKGKTIRKVIRVKKGKKITVSREET